MEERQGVVFNIQHYSIHDGPGIRTTVFLKGCPLRCRWCANPESQRPEPELMVLHNRCQGCGACVAACPVGAVRIDGGTAVTDRSRCQSCGNCVQVCRADARSVMGQRMTVSEVVDAVCEDELFYASSGGGVTLSGGEILMQADFSAELLRRCRERGLHTAVETSGFAVWDVLERVLAHADLVLYDCKHIDTKAHQQGTGAENTLILENLARLSQEMRKDVVLRIPLIHNYNDSPEMIQAIADFLSGQVPTCREVNILPYHNMGEAKKAQLDWADGYYQGSSPNSEHIEQLKEMFRNRGYIAP